ncbi:MAG: arylsulfatase [Acidobacteria bacterium]|nr:arylsulfatase [Acidobacteriota bacterium]
MNRRAFLTATAAGVSFRRQAAAAGAPRPNIVLILADDFGFGSLNCHGADRRLIRTPHLDRLAHEGVRFTDANTPSSVCTPSRYAVMTGRYCWRTPLKNGVLGITSPLHIETDRLTLASLLKGQGYRTAAIGKWHLGYGTDKTDYTRPLKPGPLQIGFDYHFAIPQNHGDATGIYVENESVAGLRSPRIQPFGKTYYGRPWMGIDAPQRADDTAMEVLTGRAVEWLGKQDGKAPFFLYFTPVAVHEPTTPSAATRGTSGAGPYGDWIHDLDLSVGRILKSLDEKGFTEDTLVIFTSDNGGVFLTQGERPEAAAYRAGLRVNGDWRGGKHGIYQGGFRVPFLVRWPGKSPAGATCGETINLVDILATVAAVTGRTLPPPDAVAEDSVNVLPAFLGKKDARPLRESMISHSADGIFAIRQGEWKYVEGKPSVPENRMPAGRRAEMERQLYNLRDDPGERNNLILSQAEVAARLADLLSTCRAQTHTRRK